MTQETTGNSSFICDGSGSGSEDIVCCGEQVIGFALSFGVIITIVVACVLFWLYKKRRSELKGEHREPLLEPSAHAQAPKPYRATPGYLGHWICCRMPIRILDQPRVKLGRYLLERYLFTSPFFLRDEEPLNRGQMILLALSILVAGLLFQLVWTPAFEGELSFLKVGWLKTLGGVAFQELILILFPMAVRFVHSGVVPCRDQPLASQTRHSLLGKLATGFVTVVLAVMAAAVAIELLYFLRSLSCQDLWNSVFIPYLIVQVLTGFVLLLLRVPLYAIEANFGHIPPETENIQAME